MQYQSIDLHVHSSCSDGTYTPSRLADYAAEKGLAAFALTDHDTIQGLSEASLAASRYGIELVPGIEFSTAYKGRDVHILGYDFDPNQAGFSSALSSFQESRDARNEEMAHLLRQKGGFDVTVSALHDAYGADTVITRAHFGRCLFENGYVSSISEAFDRYLGDHAPCFVPRTLSSPEDAVRLIRNAGGIPVLAHPLLYRLSSDALEELVCKLMEYGLLGIEAVYSTYTAGEEKKMRRLAEKYHLAISGGSDFHGKNKPHIDLGVGRGNLKIPLSVLEKLRVKKTAFCQKSAL